LSIMILEKLFNPKSVAVVGATPKEGKVGRVILENFTKKYNGRIYPVNPGYNEIFGLKCYRSVSELPEAPDLLVVAIPASSVLTVIREAAVKGVHAAIVISGGFKETGMSEGEKLERELEEISRKYGIRILGPNCLGVYDNWSGVDTFFLPKMKRPSHGYVSLVSQSGAFAAALMDWMAYHNIGVSKAVSYGNKVDIDDVELLEYLGEDENTRVILMYIEGLKPGRGKQFIEIAKRVVKKKPVVVYKAGKTSRGSLAAQSHTAAMAGEYNLYRAAFKQAGVVEVESFDEMMDAVRVFLHQPLMRGNRVYIVTNAGGVGVMLTDALTSVGFEVPQTPSDLREVLRKEFPPHFIVENPIDLTGDANDERYIHVLDILVEKPYVDVIVAVVLPQVPGIKGTLIDHIAKLKNEYEKPIVVVTIGGEASIEIARKLEEYKVTVFESPERLAKALKALYMYSTIKMRDNYYEES